MSAAQSKDPEEEDAVLQRAILNHLLDEHPSLLGRSDLIREIPTGLEGWAHRDAIERGIAELTKRNLVDWLDDYVLPTRPAVYCRILGAA